MPSKALEAFTGKAENYEQARPSYPVAAVDYLVKLLRPDAVIADVGAGTGKFTRLMAPRGFPIYAIEPNDDMRQILEQVLVPYPNARVIAATAEHTGLPEHSVDLVICAQALHWFEPAAFRAECERIGADGAYVAAIYNHMEGGQGGAHRNDAVASFFTNPRIVNFDNPISYDREAWQKYMLSHSHSPLLSDATHQSYLEQINQLFDERQVGGRLDTVVQTTIYLEQLS